MFKLIDTIIPAISTTVEIKFDVQTKEQLLYDYKSTTVEIKFDVQTNRTKRALFIYNSRN